METRLCTMAMATMVVTLTMVAAVGAGCDAGVVVEEDQTCPTPQGDPREGLECITNVESGLPENEVRTCTGVWRLSTTEFAVTLCRDVLNDESKALFPPNIGWGLQFLKEATQELGAGYVWTPFFGSGCMERKFLFLGDEVAFADDPETSLFVFYSYDQGVCAPDLDVIIPVTYLDFPPAD